MKYNYIIQINKYNKYYEKISDINKNISKDEFFNIILSVKCHLLYINVLLFILG